MDWRGPIFVARYRIFGVPIKQPGGQADKNQKPQLIFWYYMIQVLYPNHSCDTLCCSNLYMVPVHIQYLRNRNCFCDPDLAVTSAKRKVTKCYPNDWHQQLMCCCFFSKINTQICSPFLENHPIFGSLISGNTCVFQPSLGARCLSCSISAGLDLKGRGPTTQFNAEKKSTKKRTFHGNHLGLPPTQ